jgi:hypothetical protein
MMALSAFFLASTWSVTHCRPTFVSMFAAGISVWRSSVTFATCGQCTPSLRHCTVRESLFVERLEVLRYEKMISFQEKYKVNLLM